MAAHKKPGSTIALPEHNDLFATVAGYIEETRHALIRQAYSATVYLFWRIGQRINSEILHDERAEYGKQIVSRLATQLAASYGRSYETRNLRRMMQFAEQFPDFGIVSPLATQLSWAHVVEVLPLKTPEARLFYLNEAASRRLGRDGLRHLITRKAFERKEIAVARDIYRLWREPGLLDRVRADNGTVRVMAPVNQIARGAPPDAGVQWVGLEEKFQLCGESITFAGHLEAASSRRRDDPVAPVHGLFSVDFRCVHLDGEGSEPIRLTEAQAAVFLVLWEAEGKPLNAEQVMLRAGYGSAKPIDVFKRNPESKRAYVALVKTNQKDGLYWLPRTQA